MLHTVCSISFVACKIDIQCFTQNQDFWVLGKRPSPKNQDFNNLTEQNLHNFFSKIAFILGLWMTVFQTIFEKQDFSEKSGFLRFPKMDLTVRPVQKIRTFTKNGHLSPPQGRLLNFFIEIFPKSAICFILHQWENVNFIKFIELYLTLAAWNHEVIFKKVHLKLGINVTHYPWLISRMSHNLWLRQDES